MNHVEALPTLQLLVLARLLAGGEKGVTLAALSKDLKPLAGPGEGGADWADRLGRAVAELESAGAAGHPLDKKGKPTSNVSATEEGRRLARETLGIEGSPSVLKWATIRVHLVALALSKPRPTPADVKRLTGAAPGLKAEILRSRYGLALDDPLDLGLAKDATAWTLLGLEPGAPFKKDQILRALLRRAGVELSGSGTLKEADIQTALFRRELGDPKAKSPLDLIVARSVGARQSKAQELTDALLRAWVERGEPTPPTHEFDLPVFARRVLEAARTSPTGWFGDDEVFIAHVWRALADDRAIRDLGFERFKEHLIEAHRARLVELGRADLIEAMDPVDVRESATPYLNAVYHFVRTEGQAR